MLIAAGRKPSRSFSVALTALLFGLVLVAVQKDDKASGTSGGDPYSAPLVVDSNPDPNIVETTIVAQEADVDIGNGVTAHALTFNGQIPGPEFRLKVGDTVIVRFQNLLPHPTGIHWHGVEVNNASDGTPLTQNMVPGTDDVPGGGKFLYRFKVPRPGVFWYHPHHHSSTNQVFKGMYGSLIVEDPNEAALILSGVLPPASQTKTLALSDITVCDPPNDTMTYDLSLPHVSGAALVNQAGPTPATLCDTPIDEDGAPIGAPLLAGDVPNIQIAGSSGRVNEGQTVLTNGKNVGGRPGSPLAPGTPTGLESKLNVAPGEGLRLRLVNTAAIRYMRLILTYPVAGVGTRIDLVRVGGEGGLLNNAQLDGSPQPVPGGTFDFKYSSGEILLGPGERADVVAAIPSGAAGEVATMWTQDFQRVGAPPGWANIPTVPVAHFNVTGTPGSYSIAAGTPLAAAGTPVVDLGAAPDIFLNPATFVPTKDGLPNQDIQLTNVANILGVDDVQGSHDATGDYTLFPHELSSRYAELGDTLQLTVTNATDAHHPFHPHGFSIRPVSLTRAGFPTFTNPQPEFVDEVDVPARYTLTYKVHLEDRPLMDGVTMGGGHGRWVFHCHIFFHAVFGMISEIVVTNGVGNERPNVNSDQVAVTVTAGQVAGMTGTFSDPDNDPLTVADEDPVTLSASIGTVSDTGGGTWSWTRPTGPADTSEMVFITATDSNGLKSQVAFDLKINPAPPPNLSITKDCAPDQVQPGGLISCTITVTNPGPGTATNVTVTDDLPAGVTIVGGPSGGGFTCQTQAASPEIICTKASQPPGSASITYTARIPNSAQPGQKFTNTARVTANPSDPVPGNNTVSHTVSVPACTRTGAGNIVGTSGNDVICGSAGPDNISASGGNDLVFGRGGDDFITGGDGNDNLLGEGGNDSITGGNGTDRADGGAGTDTCTAELKVSCP